MITITANLGHIEVRIEFLSGTSRGPKVRGVRDLKSSKNVPLKSKNSLFFAFLHYNFKKSGGSADPTDPVLVGSLRNEVDFRCFIRTSHSCKMKRYNFNFSISSFCISLRLFDCSFLRNYKTIYHLESVCAFW